MDGERGERKRRERGRERTYKEREPISGSFFLSLSPPLRIFLPSLAWPNFCPLSLPPPLPPLLNLNLEPTFFSRARRRNGRMGKWRGGGSSTCGVGSSVGGVSATRLPISQEGKGERGKKKRESNSRIPEIDASHFSSLIKRKEGGGGAKQEPNQRRNIGEKRKERRREEDEKKGTSSSLRHSCCLIPKIQSFFFDRVTHARPGAIFL